MTVARQLGRISEPGDRGRPAAPGAGSRSDADRQHARQRSRGQAASGRRASSATWRASAAVATEASVWFEPSARTCRSPMPRR